MQTNQVLQVIVYHPTAVWDVFKFFKNDGHEVLKMSPINANDRGILVRNKEVELRDEIFQGTNSSVFEADNPSGNRGKRQEKISRGQDFHYGNGRITRKIS
jgi:hypothetical protein